jgi:hypothetical protein
MLFASEECQTLPVHSIREAAVEAATLAGWLGTAAQPSGLLPGLPALVKTPFYEPTFLDGIACTGVL